MPTPQQRLDIDRVLKSIDTPAAIVILVDGADIETATKGIDNDVAIFEICFSVARQLAEELFDNLTPEQQRQARIILPTREDAARLGILKRNGEHS